MKKILLFIFLFSLVKSGINDIIVYSLDRGQYSRTTGTLQISINVSFSQKKEENIPFDLEMVTPENLKFKCIIDFKESKISCIASITNNLLYLEPGSKIEFPTKFPEIEGIIWEYDSFIQKIYRSTLRLMGECGNPGALSLLDGNADLHAIIDDVSEGKCYSQEKMYNFDMKVKFTKFNLNNENKNNIISNNTNFSFKLLHNIYVPILFANFDENGGLLYRVNEIYRVAECAYKKEINQTDLDNIINFNCSIPLEGKEVLKGPIRIQPFTEPAYIEINNETSLISINFGIIKSTPIIENTSPQRFLAKNEYDPNKIINEITNTTNFLLLNGKKDLFICPELPIFDIKTSDRGIILEEVNPNLTNYTFTLTGYIDNLYVVDNNKLLYFTSTYKNFSFNLVIKNNFEENNEKNKHLVYCVLGSDQEVRKDLRVKIICEGERPKNKYNNNNFDISLNWKMAENQNVNGLVINWPKDSTSKKMFYYEITGLSFRKKDYGCFNNNFFFYFNIINLQQEPKIDFYMPLYRPKNKYAYCTLYNSYTLKCSVNLRTKRLTKNDYISLPAKINSQMSNYQGNKILFKMEINFLDIFSNFLVLDEECGDYIVVGTLKDAGFTFWQIVIIIITVFVLVILIVFGGIFCVIYKITHKNRKGIYFRHVEENSGANPKAIPNTSKPNLKDASN